MSLITVEFQQNNTTVNIPYMYTKINVRGTLQYLIIKHYIIFLLNIFRHKIISKLL